MPELCADRLDPPTARICQPGRERVMVMWAMTAMMIAMMTLNDSPNGLPSPM